MLGSRPFPASVRCVPRFAMSRPESTAELPSASRLLLWGEPPPEYSRTRCGFPVSGPGKSTHARSTPTASCVSAGATSMQLMAKRKHESAKRLRGRAAVARRARWLNLHPLCIECDKAGRASAATVPDHIVALANGGLDTESNLQSLCAECHRIKTARDLGHLARPQIGADGWPT